MMEVYIFGPLQGKSLAFNIYVACQSEEWCLPKKSRNCPFLPKFWSFSPTGFRRKAAFPGRARQNILYKTHLKALPAQASVLEGSEDLFNLINSYTSFY